MLRHQSSVSSGLSGGLRRECKIPWTRMTGGTFDADVQVGRAFGTTNCNKSDIE